MNPPLRPPARAPLAPNPVGSARGPAVKPVQGVEIIQPSEFERRSEPRTNCDDRGALLFLSTDEVVTVRIMDQSPSGARVAFDKIGNIPPEIWLIDLDTHMARRGSAAWSTPTRMGLKFNFVQTLLPTKPKPAKIPQEVFDIWMRLTGQTPPPETPKPDEDDSDVLYFD
ncbi:MAG TPA: hypothetical protein VG839_00835 [Asticcacaulis sp.]|nr:hypothetical protein [Asticcacaulis sp.]